MYEHHRNVWYPQTPEEGVTVPGTGVTDSLGHPPECGESNPGPPGEQPVLPTAEPSHQL